MTEGLVWGVFFQNLQFFCTQQSLGLIQKWCKKTTQPQWVSTMCMKMPCWWKMPEEKDQACSSRQEGYIISNNHAIHAWWAEKHTRRAKHWGYTCRRLNCSSFMSAKDRNLKLQWKQNFFQSSAVQFPLVIMESLIRILKQSSCVVWCVVQYIQ